LSFLFIVDSIPFCIMCPKNETYLIYRHFVTSLFSDIHFPDAIYLH